jgi:hypothetical protein
LVLKALKKAAAIDANHPDVHVGLCSYLALVEKLRGTTSPVVQDVLDTERKAATGLGGVASVAELNKTFTTKNASSLPHRLASVRVTLANETKDTRGTVITAARELLVLRPTDNTNIKVNVSSIACVITMLRLQWMHVV